MIKNRAQLEDFHGAGATPVLDAVEAAIKSVEPASLVRRAVKYSHGSVTVQDIHGKKQTFTGFGDVYVVGAGKAAAAMADELCSILKVSEAAITVPYGIRPQDSRIQFVQASHPIPDENGIMGTKRILQVLKKAKENDLVFVLVSGGGSALMPMPAGRLELADKQRITAGLLASGATIHEINAVRKHLSSVKGGQLARHVAGTTVSLILSDVVSDDLGSIASGPTFPDSSTFGDALGIIKKYNVAGDSDPAARHLMDGVSGQVAETPKPGDPVFGRVHNFLVGNNSVACNAAADSLKGSGFKVRYLGSDFGGPAADFGRLMARTATNLEPLHAVVAGGETVVRLGSKSGRGGRNQEAALAFALGLLGSSVVAAFVGTDGIDGNSDAAGALVSARTVTRGMEAYLENHDSYNALENSLVFTGLTGTNVNDITIICRPALQSLALNRTVHRLLNFAAAKDTQ